MSACVCVLLAGFLLNPREHNRPRAQQPMQCAQPSFAHDAALQHARATTCRVVEAGHHAVCRGLCHSPLRRSSVVEPSLIFYVLILCRFRSHFRDLQLALCAQVLVPSAGLAGVVCVQLRGAPPHVCASCRVCTCVHRTGP